MPNNQDDQIRRSSRPRRQDSQQVPAMPPLPPGVPPRASREPYQAKLVLGASQEPQIQRQATVASANSTSEPMGVIDYIFIGFIIFLVFAIVMVFVYIMFGQRVQISLNNFSPGILVYLLIYAGCVGVGILVGRTQMNTAAKKENIRLSQENDSFRTVEEDLRNKIRHLRDENDLLQTQLRAIPGAARVPQVSPVVAPVKPGAAPVSQPKPIEPMAAPASIYDRQLEPDDPSDLPFHPHEKPFPAPGEANSLRFDWQIVGASRRGYGHAYEGKYREDDFSVRLISAGGGRNGQGSDLALIAVADGVSSKKLSRRGARAAVEGASSLHDQRFYPLMSMIAKQATQLQLEQEARGVLMDAMSAANKQVTVRANQSGVSVDELQSTLLVYLIAPWGERNLLVASTQIGDGALFVHQLRNSRAPRERWNWLQAPQIQGSGNEVQPFMRSGPEDWARFFRLELLPDVDCIMGMTDGIADDIEPPRATQQDKNPDPFSMVDDFYQRIVVPSLAAAQPEEALMTAIGYQKKSSHDDRTVVCLYHR